MLSSITKNEILYSHYLFAFEQIKKNSNKKDKKSEKIIEICNLLNESKNILDDINQLQNISLILVQSLEDCSIKIMDIILNVFNEIIKDNLIDNSILQKMTDALFIYILKYLDNNNTNLKINKKILSISELLFSNNSLFIHNNNFINMIEICIKIFSMENENNSVFKLFNIFINKIFINFSNTKICYYPNNQYNYNCNFNFILNKQSSKEININNDKNDLKANGQLNNFIFFNEKYMDFLLDLFEIQSLIKNKSNGINLIDDYINIINKINKSEQVDYKSFKEELESLNLENLDLHYKINEEGNIQKNKNCNKIGKYGWCILCRKTSDFWSKILNFPICGDNACEKNLHNFLCNIYSKNDYINMLLILSKNSINNSSSENSINKPINFKTTELCLETIKEMLNKGVNYFKNDIDIIILIRDIFRECILKNASSQNPKIFQLSMEIFLIIFNSFKYYLKEQIGAFFMKIIINFLESESRGFIFKNIIIDSLLKLLDNSNFLVEIYANYDYDSKNGAIYCVLINLFTKILNGLFQKSKYKNIFKNIQEKNILAQKSFHFLNKYTSCLTELIDRNFIQQKYKENSIDKKNSIENKNRKNIEINKINDELTKIVNNAIELFNYGKSFDEFINYLQKEKIIYSEESFNKIIKVYINDYNNNMIKEDYSSLISEEDNTNMNQIKKYYFSNDSEFKNQKIKEGFFKEKSNNILFFIKNQKKELLPELNYNAYISFEIAYFIRLNIKHLSSEVIKNYFYNENNFSLKSLCYYIQSFNFKNKNILESLRILFSELPTLSEDNIIDKVIQIFGEKFYEQNQNQLGKNIDNGYYLSFCLIELNNNFHQNESKKKITINEFIEKINSMIQGNHKIYENQLENWYNQILNEPFKFLQNENESKNSKLNEDNFYITKIDNNSLNKLIDFSSGNFLTIYTQILNESILTNNKDLFLICVDKILNLGKICGILKLRPAQTEFINTILNMINLNEKDELNTNMMEIIMKLMHYINDNCQYINISWGDILNLISKLEYYLLEPEENIVQNLKNAKPTKFTDKEIKYFFKKRTALTLNIADAVCEAIFIKTELFDNESIINFATELCKISKHELNSYFIPRFFSLNKLIEVCNFNIFRIQFIWNKLWKIISDYLIELIISSPQEKISGLALESLKISVSKFLEKEDNLVYNFQMEIFRPFEIIFYKTSKLPEKGEIMIDYIHYLVIQYWKNIHSGWIIILRLIKNMYQKKNLNINEKIKNIIKIIYDNKDIILINNIEIFNEFMGFLCLIYADKIMKSFVFEIIVGILSKIINNDNNDKNNNYKSILIKLPNSNKIFDLIKIFFYNIDDLITINIIEFFNLLFEIINHNKKVLLSDELNTFIYMYFTYFKLNITIFLFSKYTNRLSLFNIPEEEINKNDNIIYRELTTENNIGNIIKYLEQSINYLIIDFSAENSKEYEEIFFGKDEHKIRIAGFLREIKEEYNAGKMNKYINDKIHKILKLEESDYELTLKYFFRKIP